MAWDMFTSALSEIFQRFGTAIKLTIVPFLIILVMFGGMAAIYLTNFSVSNSAGPQFNILMFFCGVLVLVATVILFAWTAVSWHRTVLMGENSGFIPSLRGLPIGRYIGNSILIGLILLIPSFIVLFLVGILASTLFTLTNSVSFVGITIITTLVGALAGVFLQFLWLRMSVVLPAIAVHRPIAIGEGWSATGDIAGAIFWLSAIMTVISTAFSLLMIPLQFVAPILVIALQIPFNFLAFIFGISIMTEIYKRVLHVDDSAEVFE